MANLSLLSLLGQAIAPQTLTPTSEEGVTRPEDYIIVQNDRSNEYLLDPERSRYAEPPPRPEVTPRYVLTEDRMSPTQDELREVIPREGMFGVKGTLRDVLGTIGDAFLVQSGNERVYAPQRERERTADSLFGFTQDPMQAIERLATHNPEAAVTLYDKYNEILDDRATQESQTANREALNADRRYTNLTQARNQVARWMGAADTPQKMQVAVTLSQRLADELGVPITQLGLNEDGSPVTEDQRAILSSGDMTVNQQQQLPLAERRVVSGERNAASGERRADAAMINANRPRKQRSETELEYFQRVSDIPAEDRTPEQNDFMRRYIEGRSGRSSRIGAPPPPPSANTLRIRSVRPAE